MAILQNESIRLEVSASGAEITHLVDVKTGEDRIWNADPTYWKRHAPVLFPNVGKLMNGVMRIHSAEYKLGQHGFARDSEFTLVHQDDTSLSYTLQANEVTKKLFPFDFTLKITYTLKGSSVTVGWDVENHSQNDMPFTIGAHPAFCFTADKPEKTHWQVCIPEKDDLEYILLDPATGCGLPKIRYSLPLDNHMLKLSEPLFAHDALVFDGTQIEEAWVCDETGAKVIGIRSAGFPNYGIWSVKNAPFVCLEPWIGRADDVGFDGEIYDKPGITVLKTSEKFHAEYDIVLA